MSGDASLTAPETSSAQETTGAMSDADMTAPARPEALKRAEYATSRGDHASARRALRDLRDASLYPQHRTEVEHLQRLLRPDTWAIGMAVFVGLTLLALAIVRLI